MDGKLKKLEEIDQFFKEKEFIKEKWIRTGISGFDNLIKNGIPEGSNIIIAGGPGCGKTIFCLQTLYNLACQGHDCVYLSMEERPERLKSHMLSFGFDVKEIKNEPNQIILSAKNCGKIALKRLQPIIIARSVEALLEKASGRLPLDIDVV
ncbi:MAG: AAA family ATPase, partial [Thermoplasmata archaeon]|nr:AAA family ATPase [Thermoplasmata archaeon]